MRLTVSSLLGAVYYKVHILLEYKLILVLIFFCLEGCGKKKEDGFLWNFRSTIVTSGDHHLAFPDLFYFGGEWFLTFGKSDKHTNSDYSQIIVLKSSDFDDWEIINQIECPSFDLRDSKFSYNEENNSFYLHFFKVNDLKRFNCFVTYNQGEGRFNDNFSFLPLLEEYPEDWLWRPIWFNGKLFVGGYSKGNVRFYEYIKLDQSPNIFGSVSGSYATESTLRFYHSDLFLVVRRSESLLMGFCPSFEENKIDFSNKVEWNKIDLFDFGGPNMVLYKNFIYLCGRMANENVVLFKISIREGKIIDEIIFPSYSWDCGYPGLYINHGILYGVYYSQNARSNEFRIEKFIVDLESFSLIR